MTVKTNDIITLYYLKKIDIFDIFDIIDRFDISSFELYVIFYK